MFESVGEYRDVKAKEYLQRALAFEVEIGDRQGEAACYGMDT